MKKKWSVLVIVLMILSVISLPVYATEDNFLADNNLIVEKSIGATTFAAGNNVKTSSTIDGINFVAGNEVEVASKQDYVFAAGNNVKMDNAEAKDAFLAGSKVLVKDSTIRDLYAAAGIVEINSNVSRNAYLAGDSIYINGTIEGDLVVSAEKVILGEKAVITGSFKYPEGSSVKKEEGAEVGKEETYKDTNVEVDFHPTFAGKVLNNCLSYLSFLVVALLLLLLKKDLFKKLDKVEKEGMTVLKSFGIGFLTLVATPIMAFIVLFTIIGVPLSILTLIIYGVLIYLAKIPTSYYFGKWILKDKIKNDYWVLVLSLLGIYILKLIPIIGGWVSFFVLCFGLGLYVRLFLESTKKK